MLKVDVCNNDSEWDLFVEHSPQGTVFAKTWFLRSTGRAIHRFWVLKGAERVGAFLVAVDEQQRPIRLPLPFMQYSSLMFAASRQSAHKQIELEFRITQRMIDEVLSTYGALSLVHSPLVTDMRPFLWHNYHAPEKGMFDVKVRYTAILHTTPGASAELIDNLRTCRRQEYRKAQQCDVRESSDVTTLDLLHGLTFSRQGIDRSDSDAELLRRITSDALAAGAGRLSFGFVNDVPASGVLFLFDNKRGYYLFGANHPEFRSSGISTRTLMDNIHFTSDHLGLREVDFVGVNSPNRGDYKLSFNPSLVPYFETHLGFN